MQQIAAEWNIQTMDETALACGDTFVSLTQEALLINENFGGRACRRPRARRYAVFDYGLACQPRMKRKDYVFTDDAHR